MGVDCGLHAFGNPPFPNILFKPFISTMPCTSHQLSSDCLLLRIPTSKPLPLPSQGFKCPYPSAKGSPVSQSVYMACTLDYRHGHGDSVRRQLDFHIHAKSTKRHVLTQARLHSKALEPINKRHSAGHGLIQCDVIASGTLLGVGCVSLCINQHHSSGGRLSVSITHATHPFCCLEQ